MGRRCPDIFHTKGFRESHTRARIDDYMMVLRHFFWNNLHSLRETEPAHSAKVFHKRQVSWDKTVNNVYGSELSYGTEPLCRSEVVDVAPQEARAKLQLGTMLAFQFPAMSGTRIHSPWGSSFDAAETSGALQHRSHEEEIEGETYRLEYGNIKSNLEPRAYRRYNCGGQTIIALRTHA